MSRSLLLLVVIICLVGVSFQKKCTDTECYSGTDIGWCGTNRVFPDECVKDGASCAPECWNKKNATYCAGTCSDHTSCSDCLSSTSCYWCGSSGPTGTCMPSYDAASGPCDLKCDPTNAVSCWKTSKDACPVVSQCSLQTSCFSCASSNCAWCGATGKCNEPTQSKTAMCGDNQCGGNGPSECFKTDISQCPVTNTTGHNAAYDCSVNHGDCEKCTASNPMCGYCSDTQKCVESTVSGTSSCGGVTCAKWHHGTCATTLTTSTTSTTGSTTTTTSTTGHLLTTGPLTSTTTTGTTGNDTTTTTTTTTTGTTSTTGTTTSGSTTTTTGTVTGNLTTGTTSSGSTTGTGNLTTTGAETTGGANLTTGTWNLTTTGTTGSTAGDATTGDSTTGFATTGIVPSSTTTGNSNSTGGNPSKHHGLHKVEIAFIIVGAIGGVAAAGVGVWFYKRKTGHRYEQI